MKFEEHPRIVAHVDRITRLSAERSKLEARQKVLESLPKANSKSVEWDEADSGKQPKVYFSQSEYDKNAERIRELELLLQAGTEFFVYGKGGLTGLRDQVGLEMCHERIPQFVSALRGLRSSVTELQSNVMKAVGVIRDLERDGIGVYQPIDQSSLGPLICYDFTDEESIFDTWLKDIDDSIARCSEHLPSPAPTKRTAKPEQLVSGA